jgi:hypothetical protein
MAAKAGEQLPIEQLKYIELIFSATQDARAGMASTVGREPAPPSLRFWLSGPFDFLNQQRNCTFEVFPVHPTEDSTEECTRPATNIHRKANCRLAGLILRENVVVENL